MISLTILSLRVKTTITANRLIYFFSKIIFLKKLFPQMLYSELSLKAGFTVLAAIMGVFRKILLRLLAVALYVFIGILIFQVSESGGYRNFLEGGLSIRFTGLNIASVAVYVLTTWFIFTSVGGLFSPDTLLNPLNHLGDKTMLQFLRADAALFAKSRMLLTLAGDFLLYLPYLIILFLIAELPIWGILPLMIMYSAFRLMGNVLNLFVFAKIGKHFGENILSVPSSALILAAAFTVPVFFELPPWAAVVTSPLVLILSVTAGVLACLYLKKYPKYAQILRVSLWQNEFYLNKAKANSSQNGAALNLAEAKKWHKTISADDVESDKHKNKSGFSYLNAIFFDRHSNFFRKKLLKRCLIILAPLAAVAVLSVFNFFAPDLFDADFDPFRFAPFFFFLTYLTSMGSTVTAAVFSNCDIHMLHYSYYRTRETTAASFKSRFAAILRFNTILTAVMAFSALLIARILAGPLHTAHAAVFAALLLCMGLFFSFNDLFLYYVIQPYDTAGNSKSIVHKIINWVIYFLAFMSLNLRLNFIGYSIFMAVLTALYLAIGSVLLLKFAPGRFRLR
jgi:hypothetical protein